MSDSASPLDAAVTLTVLGSCGGYPEPGRACSGLLLRHGADAVVLDLGYGTLSPLLAALDGDVGQVSAVVVTHAHPDHMADLSGLARTLRYAGLVGVPLLAPAQVLEVLVASQPGSDDPDTFAWHPLPGRHLLDVATVIGVETPHWVPNVAVRVELAGRTVAYSGDSGPSSGLVAAARDADLFVCGATELDTDDDAAGFLTDGEQAGAAAAEAGSGALLLTHFWPGGDREQTGRAAASTYDGRVVLATEGLQLTV